MPNREVTQELKALHLREEDNVRLIMERLGLTEEDPRDIGEGRVFIGYFGDEGSIDYMTCTEEDYNLLYEDGEELKNGFVRVVKKEQQ